MLLKIFFFNFCDSGPDMFSKELQKNCFQNRQLYISGCFVYQISYWENLEAINELICKTLYRRNYPWSHQIQNFFSYIVFIKSESLFGMLYCFYQFFFNDCHRLSIFHGFCCQFFRYWWAELYKKFLLLFLIALNHSITDMVYCHCFTWVFSLILMLIS